MLFKVLLTFLFFCSHALAQLADAGCIGGITINGPAFGQTLYYNPTNQEDIGFKMLTQNACPAGQYLQVKVQVGGQTYDCDNLPADGNAAFHLINCPGAAKGTLPNGQGTVYQYYNGGHYSGNFAIITHTQVVSKPDLSVWITY
jgi:hypothetical protein